MGTIKDSINLHSELDQNEEYVFKENQDALNKSSRPSEKIMEKKVKIDKEKIRNKSQKDHMKRLKNLSFMKMINNGLHLDRK